MSDPAAAAAAQAAMEAQLAAVQRFNIEAFTLLGIALTATLLRTYARISAVGIRNLKPDDYLVWVGAVRTHSHHSSRASTDETSRSSMASRQALPTQSAK